jgi:hypothetical protein
MFVLVLGHGIIKGFSVIVGANFEVVGVESRGMSS